MIQAGTLAMPLLSELNQLNTFEMKAFGFERNRPDLTFENNINNYLKTPAEMDADFCLEMGEQSLLIKEWVLFEKDGYINAYSPDVAHSGFMEENY